MPLNPAATAELQNAANNSPIIHVVTIKILARLGKMYRWYCRPYRMKRNLSIATSNTDNTDTSVDETIIPETRRKNELSDAVVRHTSQLIFDFSSDQLQLTLEMRTKWIVTGIEKKTWLKHSVFISIGVGMENVTFAKIYFSLAGDASWKTVKSIKNWGFLAVLHQFALPLNEKFHEHCS